MHARRTMRTTVALLALAFLGNTPQTPAECLDQLEDIGTNGTQVTTRNLCGVIVQISPSTMRSLAYGTNTSDGFLGAGVMNTPLNPGNVSGQKFITTDFNDNNGFNVAQPIEFVLATPVASFGVTSLDLLENGSGGSVSLTAYDGLDQVVDVHSRTGDQGLSGLDLDWQVSSPYTEIVRVVLSGSVDPNFAGYGLDDILLDVDCNSNGLNDICDLDCGGLGGTCNVPGCGASQDCNANGQPDECESIAANVLNETTLDTYCAIQDCIDAASNGDVCAVSPGVYNELIDFLGKSLTVRSVSGRETTTIDGSGLGGAVVTFASGETKNAVLRGFTVTGGSGTTGGGIFIQGSSPVILNSDVAGNTASSAGGGAYVFDGAPRFVGVDFRDNAAPNGGGLTTSGTSDTQVFNARFIRNHAAQYGGGVGIGGSAAVGRPDFGNCVFSDNTASIGGGAIYCDRSNPELVNVTALQNHADTSGGGFWVTNNNSEPFVLINCVVAENTRNAGADAAAQINDIQGTVSVSNSCVYPCGSFCSVPADSNIDADPIFADSNGHLSPTSPPIDAGDTSALPSGLYVDLDGNGRVLDDPLTADTGVAAVLIPVTVDMGAYEYQLAGDLDFDGDVDLADYAIFAASFTGPNGL